ncbi:MAG: hypothetical protein AB7V67_06965 [Tepidiphilus sp.]
MIPPLLVLVVGLFITVPVSFVVALPLAMAFRRFGRLNAINLCLAGAIVGAVSFGAFAYRDNYWPQMNDQELARWGARQAAIGALLPGGIYGLLSALAFAAGGGVVFRSRR